MTVLELKEILKDLPDDMEIEIYTGRQEDVNISSHWIMSNDLDAEYEEPSKLVLSIY